MIKMTTMCPRVRGHDDEQIANCFFYSELDLNHTNDIWFDVGVLAKYTEEAFWSVVVPSRMIKWPLVGRRFSWRGGF